MSLEATLQSLDGRTMTLAEGVATADGTLSGGMIEIDFRLSTTGEDVIVEELVAAGSVFRLPLAGEVAVLGFVDGDRNEGYVLGWLPKPDASPANGRIVAGKLWLFPPEGEGIVAVSPSIQLGSEAAAQAVALAPLVASLLATREGAYGSHTHIVPVPLIPVGPAPSAPPLPPLLGSANVGAAKVTAE